MFTGLVEDIGEVSKVSPNTEGCRFSIITKKLIGQIKVNDSIAVNGVCQTVIAKEKDTFDIQCVHVSLKKTTLRELKVASKVNLELALGVSARLGGHIVQGHVNGVGVVNTIESRGKNYHMTFKIDSDLFRYVICEGSIAINGVSLTVASVYPDKYFFSVSIIPHTFDMTTFSLLNIGDRVNIEVDVIAKYVENFLNKRYGGGNKISQKKLEEEGFLNDSI